MTCSPTGTGRSRRASPACGHRRHRTRRTRPHQPRRRAASEKSEFAGLWERYEVTGRKPAHKTFQHPQVGTVTLTSQSLHVEGTPGQRIGVYTAELGTPDHDALLLLNMTAPASPGVSSTQRNAVRRQS
ncbi:hypothetical protein SAZ11_03840 [Streptomyces sp. FXJ1.4098]|nr:hypothetical protein [Streptomyces sp. FXJ1.4098]